MQGFNMNWGLISAVLIFLSGYPYVRGIIDGSISKPVTSTWLLWLGIGILLLITNYQAGARWDTTLLPVLMGVINPAVFLVLSLRYGEYKWTGIDTTCVIICLIAVIVWQTTGSAVLGLIGVIIADVVAALPQVIKNWKDPKDEPFLPWTVFTFASGLNILAISEWTIGKALFPVYMTVFSALALTLPVVLHRLRLKLKLGT